LTRFLDDGRIDLDSNIVERSMRPRVLTRKNALSPVTTTARKTGLSSRRSSRLAYAGRGISKFMPPAELCRTVSE
jgi:transposase IS66 family protein